MGIMTPILKVGGMASRLHNGIEDLAKPCSDQFTCVHKRYIHQR